MVCQQSQGSISLFVYLIHVAWIKKGKKIDRKHNECYVLEPHVYKYSFLFTRLISFYVYMYAYWITYLLRK